MRTPTDERPLDQFQLHVPLLSRVGADRADTLRTDIDAAVAGWSDALLRVDSRNQVLISDGRVVLGKATALGDKPTDHAVFLGRMKDGRHVWGVRSVAGRAGGFRQRNRGLGPAPRGPHLRRRQRATGGHRDRTAELARQRALQHRRRVADEADQRRLGAGQPGQRPRSSRGSTRR